jgi:hypothetical protein
MLTGCPAASLGRESRLARQYPSFCSLSNSQQQVVKTRASANLSFGASTQAVAASSPPTENNWSLETVDDDWTFESKTVGLSSSKALKINMDLKLVSIQLFVRSAC